METFSALLAICAGNSPVPGEFPTQRPVTRSFDVYFDLRPNKRLSKQSWGWWFETLSCSLWRHRNVNIHYLNQHLISRMDTKMWDAIVDPCPNSTATYLNRREVGSLMRNYILYKFMDIITYSCPRSHLNNISKTGPIRIMTATQLAIGTPCQLCIALHCNYPSE